MHRSWHWNTPLQSFGFTSIRSLPLLKIANNSMTQPLVKRDDTDLLTTEQAAQLMGHSRPYVAMLIDANKLKGGSVSEVGHRRVPRSSVLAWIKKANKKNKAGDANYKAAALEAGMYDIPEVQVVRIIAKGKRRYLGKNCSP